MEVCSLKTVEGFIQPKEKLLRGFVFTPNQFIAGSFTPSPGSQNASASANLNDIGHDFLDCNAKMGPPFNSVALQQYILLCSQVLYN